MLAQVRLQRAVLLCYCDCVTRHQAEMMRTLRKIRQCASTKYWFCTASPDLRTAVFGWTLSQWRASDSALRVQPRLIPDLCHAVSAHRVAAKYDQLLYGWHATAKDWIHPLVTFSIDVLILQAISDIAEAVLPRALTIRTCVPSAKRAASQCRQTIEATRYATRHTSCLRRQPFAHRIGPGLRAGIEGARAAGLQWQRCR